MEEDEIILVWIYWRTKSSLMVSTKMFNLKSLIIKDNHIMVKAFIFISRLLFES